MKTASELEKKYGNFYAPEFSIKIENIDIKSKGAEVAGITVDKVLDGASQFSFSVNNPYVASKSEFQWIDDTFFDAGKKVAITIGYANGEEQTMLSGLITSLKYTFPSGGASQLEISGYDFSYYMMKGKKSPPAWNKKKHSDIVQLIASDYKFKTNKIQDSKLEYPQVKQDNESDYDFIKKLAEQNGFEFYLSDDNELIFGDAPINNDSVLSLQLGKTLFSFSPELNITEQISEVKVIGWDPKAKKEIIGKATAGEEEGKKSNETSGSEMTAKIIKDKVTKEIRRPVGNQAEADKIAKSTLSKISEGLVKGSGECIGLPVLQPGIVIDLEGLGTKFSKSYYVEKTTHSIGSSGYKTTFNVRRNTI